MKNRKTHQEPLEDAPAFAWGVAIKKYLISRKKMHVLSYQDISARLKTYHMNQSPQNLSAKFNQGKLSASLFASSLIAMGEKEIDLKELQKIFEDVQENNSSHFDKGTKT